MRAPPFYLLQKPPGPKIESFLKKVFTLNRFYLLIDTQNTIKITKKLVQG